MPPPKGAALLTEAGRAAMAEVYDLQDCKRKALQEVLKRYNTRNRDEPEGALPVGSLSKRFRKFHDEVSADGNPTLCDMFYTRRRAWPHFMGFFALSAPPI